MGLQDHLVGVTFECPAPGKEVVVRSHMEDLSGSSKEIDEEVNAAGRAGDGLYFVEEEKLRRLAPDLIFTQDVCDVCQIGNTMAEQAVAPLARKPELVPLSPVTLKDVLGQPRVIARALGNEEAGEALSEELRERLSNVEERSLREGETPVEVALLEWPDPIYACGHWIPDQIRSAGGVDKLGTPGGHSRKVSWEELYETDPEVIVIAPCGFDVERGIKEAQVLFQKPGWDELKAVRNGRVHVCDAELFTQPGTTLIDGVELLAGLFHPERFDIPRHLRSGLSDPLPVLPDGT